MSPCSWGGGRTTPLRSTDKYRKWVTKPVCIARVGKVVGAEGGKGRVEFFDGKALDRVDLSVTGARAGAYVEVFGDLALSVLTESEARVRKKEWRAVMRAAGRAR